MKQPEVKEAILLLMENHIDAVMKENSFTRRPNSLDYIRKIGTTKQIVEMVFYSNPSYMTGAFAHVYPWISVYYPEVNEVANEMVTNKALLANLSKVTIRQPAAFSTKSGGSYYLMRNGDNDSAMDELCEFFISNPLPLLDELKDSRGFIKTYEQEDARLMPGDHRYVFLASAYVSNGDITKGLEVLEKNFGKPGPRKRYNEAFQYFENLIS